MESSSPAQEIETSNTITVTSNNASQTFISTPEQVSATQGGDWTSLIHGLRFTHNGKYVSGYVDSSQDLMQLLDNYRTITMTGFSNAQSLASTIKSVEDNLLQTRFMSPSSRPRLFWQMNAGEPSIPYDGVPFMSVGHGTDLPCVRYGGRRKKMDNITLPSGDVIPVDYRMKTGCEAKITIRKVLRYPSAEFTDMGQQGIAAVRRSRKQLLDDLIQKIIAGIAKPSERYYFLLPTPMAHSGHTVPEIEAAPSIAQAISDEIITQLSTGVTDILQLQEHIRNFANVNFATDASDSTFFPSEYDIFRHVYWLYNTGQVIDQESALKATIGGLTGMDQSLTSTISTMVSPATSNAISKLPVTSSAESLTNVYSIIMDDGSGSDGAAALEHLSNENQIQTTNQRDMDQLTQSSSSGMQTESPISSQVQLGSVTSNMGNQITVSNTSTPSVSQVKRGGVGTTVSNIALSTMTRQPARNTASLNESGDDSAVSQAQTEVRDMLKIIENQSHACSNLKALNTLRRQLTELCGQFSMFLAGVPSTDFSSPPSKKMKI